MAQLYSEKEVVGVKDKGRLYEAKILKAQYWDDTWHYFVHFQGWNKKWDRWTEEKDISKKTGTIKRRYNAKDKVILEDSDQEEGEREEQEETTTEPTTKKARSCHEENLEEETNDENLLLKLQIPFTLKKHLTDEWEVISKSPHRLLVLPRPNTVEGIINQFIEDKVNNSTDTEQNEKLRNLFQCLTCYFNKVLPLILLYHNEREQYNQISRIPDFQPSLVYGAEHLLRLFVKLPQFFVNIEISTTDLRYLKQKFTEFLKFLQKSSSTFFNLSDYQIQKPPRISDNESSTHGISDNLTIVSSSDSITHSQN